MSIFLLKARVVAAARLNRVFPLYLTLGLSCFATLSRQAAANPSPTIKAQTCELLSRGPDVQLLQQEAMLDSFLKDFLSALREKKLEALKNFFHPRAKVSSSIGEKIQAILDNRYDSPLQFSVYRVWRLRSTEASKAIVRDCPESDGASVITQYGYEKQFAVWLQIMGQNELGRLILALAPDKGKISIVGFRIQQWTQQGSDWEAWAKQAQTYLQSGEKIQAYFAFDVAQKLVMGEDFILYPSQKQLADARDQIYSQADLVNQLNQQLKTQSIAYVGSLLTKEGTGVFLREIVSPSDTTKILQDLCKKRGQSLQSLNWLKDNQGLRCNFIFAGMDPTQDSQLGGFYFSPSDLKNPQK